MKNKIILFGLVLLFLFNVSASETQLLCLNQGETVKFSECNPAILDRTCESSGVCQYCVSYNPETGVYCPTNFNSCNEIPDVSCSELILNEEVSGNEIEIESVNFDASIAYVLKDESGINNNLLNILEELGHSYTIVYEEGIEDIDFNNFDIILVGNQEFNDVLSIPVNEHRSLILNQYHYYGDDQFGFSGGYGTISSPSIMNIRDLNDPLVLGIEGNFNGYNLRSPNVKSYMLKREKPIGIDIVVSTSGSMYDSIIATFKQETVYLNGNVAEEKAVFFGVVNVEYWTDETKLVFSNSLDWLMREFDFDAPPVISEFDCEVNILEDTGYNCEINAFDPDNNSITYKIVNENNLYCEFENNVLHYISKEDYFGLASCEILVKDDYHGSNKYIFEVEIENVNDPPRIIGSSQEEDLIFIAEGFDLNFDIDVLDVDGDLIDSKWIVNGNQEGNEEDFLFKKEKGGYFVEVIVADNLTYENKFWSVVVGDANEFMCSDMGGQICGEEQICSGEDIESKDGLCCLSECIKPGPMFRDADVCELKNNDIIIEIKSPDRNDEIKIGEDFEVEIELKNNYDEEQDIDFYAILYDLDDDEVIEKKKGSSELRVNSRRTYRLDLEVPHDVDLDNDYAVLVIAEDEICNYEYQDIDIERPDSELIFNNIEMGEGVCGKTTYVNIELENVGLNDQDVIISLRNTKLGIDEKTESINIERYGRDNVVNVGFEFLVPDNMGAGLYNIALRADGQDIISENLIFEVNGCYSQEKVENIEPLSLILNNEVKNIPGESEGGDEDRYVIIATMLLTSFVALAFLFLAYRLKS